MSCGHGSGCVLCPACGGPDEPQKELGVHKQECARQAMRATNRSEKDNLLTSAPDRHRLPPLTPCSPAGLGGKGGLVGKTASCILN
jgi:hypothetical protein